MSQAFRFDRVEVTAEKILDCLHGADSDYAVLGCAMVVGRLMNLERKLDPEEEVKWLQSMIGWADLYWAPTGEAN